MPLTRCSEQNKQTLEEFYSEWASSDVQVSADIGKSMLSLIALMNTTFKTTKIYGLTSHAHLLLHSQDSIGSDWFVSIIANGHEFYIEYILPKHKAPWSGALAKGVTNSIDEFRDYIIVAMRDSLGWTHSLEVEQLYQALE